LLEISLDVLSLRMIMTLANKRIRTYVIAGLIIATLVWLFAVSKIPQFNWTTLRRIEWLDGNTVVFHFSGEQGSTSANDITFKVTGGEPVIVSRFYYVPLWKVVTAMGAVVVVAGCLIFILRNTFSTKERAERRLL
jgi:hypothetical protein